MNSLLSSLSSSLTTPEIIGGVSKMLGIDADQVARAAQLAGPVMIEGLAGKAATEGGIDAIGAMLTSVGPDLISDPVTALSGIGSGKYGNVIGELFGNAGGALLNGLTRSTGIHGLGALMNIVAPLGLSQLAAAAKQQGVDIAGLAKLINAEAKEMASSDDPNVRTVRDAVAEVDRQEALKKQFSADEWKAVSMAPALAAGYVAAAGKSGPFGSIKEFAALAKAFDPAGIAAGSTIVDAVMNAAQGAVEQAAETGDLAVLGLENLDPKDPAQVKTNVLDVLEAARGALNKLSHEEAAAYKSTVVKAATSIAEASKEGGFLGIGGKTISEGEQVALDNIRKALDI